MFCKLDRMLGNELWMQHFSDAMVNFLPERYFDHSPGILALAGHVNRGRRPFRYCNMWRLALDFSEQEPIQGVPMYCLVAKLKRLKVVLKDINRGNFDNIEKTERNCLMKVQLCQEALRSNPGDTTLADEELVALNEYKMAHKAYLSFLQQKCKLHWAKSGDKK